MRKCMLLVIAMLVFGCMAWAAEGSWIGTVSDEHCGLKHAAASDAAAACVAKCVSGGSKYTLVSHGKQYSVDPQDKFADFAGKSVKVTGTMTGTNITAESVEAAPAKMTSKKKEAGM